MLISADVKGLEVVAAAFLSECPVLRQELLSGRDLHEDNRIKFNLGTRDSSKRFKFKMIFGGTAPGFVNDPVFQHLNYNKKKWQEIIDEYYTKYNGLYKWHQNLIDSALKTGIYQSPSGRTYNYSGLFTKHEEWYYIPKIKNYPVQGFGADVVMLARIDLFRRVKREAKAKSLFVNTIHDSIIIDSPINEVRGVDSTGKPCYNICSEIKEVFEGLPQLLTNTFNINFDLPINVEIKKLTGESL